MKSGKSTKRLKPSPVAIVGVRHTEGKQPSGQQIQQSQKSKEISEAANPGFAKWMAVTFGTSSKLTSLRAAVCRRSQ